MKVKNCLILAGSGILVLTLIGFYLHLCKPVDLPSGPGMILPFKKVSGFIRPATFLVPKLYSKYLDGQKPGVLGLYLLDSSNNGGFWEGPVVEDREIPHQYDHWDGFIAVKPDNSAFYIGTEKQLIEFDNNLNIKRKIPISAFKFGSGKFECGNRVTASNEKMWFTVNKLNSWTQKSKSYTTFLVEWCPANSPSTRIIVDDIDDIYAGGIAVDMDKRRVFLSSLIGGVRIYDFATQKFQTRSYGKYDFIDFDKNLGLLLSNLTIQEYGERPAIVKIDPKDEAKQVVTDGLGAVWGSDGYVYFRDGYSELWRCRSDGSDRQPVYVAKSGKLRTRTPYYPPKVSSDRTLLAVNYSYDRVYGMVFLDLKNKEYTEVPGIMMNIDGYHHMAWLIKNSKESESFQNN